MTNDLIRICRSYDSVHFERARTDVTIMKDDANNAVAILLPCEGIAMDNIIYWGAFILFLLSGLGIPGTN